MPTCQRRGRLPSRWLMTDERMGEALWTALERLPRGSGVVFRHYALVPDARRRLFERVRAVTRRRGLMLSLADTPLRAAAWRADGVHGASPHRCRRPMLRSMACHDRRALVAAARIGVSLRFVSPVFATRSHPEKAALGRARFGLMLDRDRGDIVALGGMSACRARSLRAMDVGRWAAIDAWIE